MKNYFYGINVRTHFHLDNRLKKNILSGNNYDHVRYEGVQSIVSSQTWRLKGIDPTMNAEQRGLAIQDRMDKLNEMTGNNPNMKMSKEAFDAIASGKDVSVKIDNFAPERRNLFIGGLAAIAQVIGGLMGAAYTKELGDAVSGRVGGDNEFITKHGNNFTLNPFGGAEVQGGQINVSPVDREKPILANEDVSTKIINANIIKAGATSEKRESKIDEFKDAKKYEHLSGYMHRGGLDISGGKGTIEKNFIDEFKDRYGVENFHFGDANSKLFKTGTVSRTESADAKLDFLTLAQKAGLINEDQLNEAKKGGKSLQKVFLQAEGALEKLTGNKIDQMLGGQHVTNLQFALNAKIKELGASATQIGDLVNGRINVDKLDTKGQELLAKTLKLYNEANGGSLTMDQFKAQLKSGNLTGLESTLGTIKGKIDDITSTIKTTAGGLYGKHNAALAETLGTDVTGKDVTGTDKEGRSIGKFKTQVNDVIAHIQEKLNGGNVSTTVGEGAPTTTGSLGAQAKVLNDAFAGGKSLSSEDKGKVLNTFGNVLAGQLAANGVINKETGKAFTGDEALKLAQAFATASPDKQKEMIEANPTLKAAIAASPTLQANLTAVGTLANTINTNFNTNQKSGAEQLQQNIGIIGNAISRMSENIRDNTALYQGNSFKNVADAIDTVRGQLSQQLMNAGVPGIKPGDKLTNDQLKALVDPNSKTTLPPELLKAVTSFLTVAQAQSVLVGQSNVNQLNTANAANSSFTANEVKGMGNREGTEKQTIGTDEPNKKAAAFKVAAIILDGIANALFELADKLIAKMHSVGFDYGFSGENHGSITKPNSDLSDAFKGFKSFGAGKDTGFDESGKKLANIGGFDNNVIKNFANARLKEEDPNQVGANGKYLVNDLTGQKEAKFKSLNEFRGLGKEQGQWTDYVGKGLATAGLIAGAYAMLPVGLITTKPLEAIGKGIENTWK